MSLAGIGSVAAVLVAAILTKPPKGLSDLDQA
jgi:hypothetical protein